MTKPTLSPGKVRGLAATSSPEGIFKVLAIDHRDSLRVFIDPENPQRITARQLTDVKLDLIAKLGRAATAAMLDPEFSAAQAIVSRALPGSVGFLAAIEEQGYLGDPTARQTSLLKDWGVAKAKRLGANGIKLLVLYRPDGGAVTSNQERVVESVVADCAQHDIPLFLEPLIYALEPGLSPDSADFAAKRRRIVVDTVRRLGALGPDILKVQFPVDTRFDKDRSEWAEACDELNEISPVPWALLSGGDPYELFKEQLHVACDAGASGFMVGRALWGEYVRADPADQPRIMEQVVRPRLAELSSVAVSHGHDWADRYELPAIDEHWYTTYR